MSNLMNNHKYKYDHHQFLRLKNFYILSFFKVFPQLIKVFILYYFKDLKC